MAAVLVTDLVGSTELFSRLGEATFDGVCRAHFFAMGLPRHEAMAQELLARAAAVRR